MSNFLTCRQKSHRASSNSGSYPRLHPCAWSCNGLVHVPAKTRCHHRGQRLGFLRLCNLQQCQLQRKIVTMSRQVAMMQCQLVALWVQSNRSLPHPLAYSTPTPSPAFIAYWELPCKCIAYAAAD